MSEAGRFEFLDDVTSDLAFVARGPSLEAVFEAAGSALLAATVENPEAVRAVQRCRIELSEEAPDLLLLRFLNELVYLRDAERLLLRPRSVRIRGGARLELEAELEGEVFDAARHRPGCEVKATTAHGLRVGPVDGGFEARVTFDV